VESGMYSCVVDNGGFSEEVAAGGAVWLPGYRQVVHDMCAPRLPGQWGGPVIRPVIIPVPL